MRRPMVAGVGGMVSALLGSLCCLGPVLFVTLGVGAGLASTFEPLRPFFGLLMLGLFATGFYTAYGNNTASSDVAHEQACPLPRSRRKDKLMLWGAFVLALVLWTFPTWSVWLI